MSQTYLQMKSLLFKNLRPTLVELRKEILDKKKPKSLVGVFKEETQLKLANELAIKFGYDLNRGRIDKAVHPFPQVQAMMSE